MMIRKVIVVLLLAFAIFVIYTQSIVREIWSEATVDGNVLRMPVLDVERSLTEEDLSFTQPFTLKYTGRYEVMFGVKRNPAVVDREGGSLQGSFSIDNSDGETVFETEFQQQVHPSTAAFTIGYFHSDVVGLREELVFNFEITGHSDSISSQNVAYIVGIVRDSRIMD